MPKNTEKTRQALFDATLAIIGEQGYTGTTVDAIVERAGVAKGTVYYHFRSKAELVEALIAEKLAPLAKRFSEAASTTSDPAEQLAAIARTELEFIRDDRAFAKLLVTEMWREDRVWRETLVLLRGNALAVIREVLSAGIDAGEFSAQTDTTVTASAIFGLVATVALDWLALAPDRSIDDVAAHVQRLVVGVARA